MASNHDLILNTVYNHYLTTYAPKKSSSEYDTHKKSELRGIYNSMVKLNKETPLYILDSSADSRAFAVGLKENARLLRNTIASLGGLDEDSMFSKKAAYSTNEDMVSADFIGSVDEKGSGAPTFNIEVTSLASNQENLGYALPSNEPVSMPSDTYSFDITINDLSYEFQFNIRESETNRNVQDKLARLINNSNIGINADVLENGKGQSALRLTSQGNGTKDNQDFIFKVSDEHSSKRGGSVDYLGIDYVSKKPSNAEFLLNGEERSASSNHFTVDGSYELNLNKVRSFEGDIAEIGLKNDTESMAENVQSLLDGYNSFIEAAKAYQSVHPKSGQLLGEMGRLSDVFKNELTHMGVNFEEDGTLSLNGKEFRQALVNSQDDTILDNAKSFANAVLRKINQISINPMEYIEKTVVAYKNPGHNFNAPYVSSNYSGMLFNSYC